MKRSKKMSVLRECAEKHYICRCFYEYDKSYWYYYELFEEVSRHEVGMDVLTKLLNRRFLPTIFKREIAHANRTGTPLSVLIIVH